LYLRQIREIKAGRRNGQIERAVEAARTLSTMLSLRGKSHSFTLLVDDYSDRKGQVDREDVREIFSGYGLIPDYIVLESEMVKSAEYFLRSIPGRHLTSESNVVTFRSHSSDVHFNELLMDTRRYKQIFINRMRGGTGSSGVAPTKSYMSVQDQRCHSSTDIVLVYNDNGYLRYGCPVLAACWYLTRLGVDPFISNLTIEEDASRPFTGRQLLTILPVGYMKVEATALELIGLCRNKSISRCGKRMDYMFVGDFHDANIAW
jgi:hypothetical protein